MKMGEVGTLANRADPGNWALAPGAVLDGRFAITEVLSEGGMATLFKARDLFDNDATVALKVPHKQAESDPGLFSRFQREEEIGCALDHPSVLKFVHVKNKSRPYLATEFLNGKTLYHVLRERRPLPEAEAMSIAARICDALEYLSSHGVIHRDLKPENVMLCDDGSLRLMDFGIAWGPHARRLTFMGFAPGTPHYMAPERVAGRRGDGRVDIYSVGAILYEMLTGKIAFDDQDISVIMEMRVTGDPEAPRKINPRISRQAEEIVLQAMERDPEKRYPTAKAMKAELEAPQSVKLTGRSDRLQVSTLWKRRWRKARWVALWVMVPVILQVIAFFLLWHHLARHRR
ncbi:MAG TPA: serine/threonine-protein kinase [Candidatus Baltobacteraceae bacterium]|jgi:serine/threonine-protein kinase|nr:serine/threonine-protein kinase [Candidatus Baltobacteraceae bacterium]